MRTTAKYISAAIAGILVLASCDDNEINALQGIDGPHISLTVNIGDPQLMVKSAVAGEDTYNENLMNSIHYFFFAKGSTSTAVVKGSASGISKTDSYTEDIPISTADLNGNLFGADRKCNLFVIANAPESMSELLSGNPTLAQLRAASVISNMNKVPQSNFVMVYDDEIEIDSRADKTAIDVEIEMKRLACKFTFKADVKKEIKNTDGSKTVSWTAGTGTDVLSVTFGNGISKTTPAGFNKTAVEDDDYFETDPVNMTYVNETGTGDYALCHYTAATPIYSYPMEWVFTDQFEPYILFDLVWDYKEEVGGVTTRQFPEHRYYKMVLGQQSITSNDWYVITAKLSTLGNLLPRDPLVLFSGLNYTVKKWNDAFETDKPNTPANIKSTRYLMVPQTSWKVNNETECVIPISTSHPCEVANVVVKKTVFFDKNYKDPENGNAARPNKPHDVTVVDWANSVYDSYFSFTPNADWSELTFRHVLHNTLDNSLDISPYWIELDVQHSDDPSFTEHISITQYPAIWVENQLNSAGENGSTVKGYAYVNNQQVTNATYSWMNVKGAEGSETSSGSNTSRYMTIIHVSQFQPGAQFTYNLNKTPIGYCSYLVGDPRVNDVNNLDKNTSSTGIQWTDNNPVTGGALYDNASSRQLKYYYPTSTDFEKSGYVAPVLRVCSGHAKMSANVTYERVEQRCASYQEDGYPAGRWRIPTMAEAKLIVFLSVGEDPDHPYSFIPQLLTATGGYAFAGGIVQNMEWGVMTGLNVRCVYDEWYWSKVDKDLGRKHGSDLTDEERKTFVWGDVPRDYTIVP